MPEQGGKRPSAGIPRQLEWAFQTAWHARPGEVRDTPTIPHDPPVAARATAAGPRPSSIREPSNAVIEPSAAVAGASVAESVPSNAAFEPQNAPSEPPNATIGGSTAAVGPSNADAGPSPAAPREGLRALRQRPIAVPGRAKAVAPPFAAEERGTCAIS